LASHALIVTAVITTIIFAEMTGPTSAIINQQ
jgi:hypothetical protein